MTDEQSKCEHEPDPVLFVCRKCRLSDRAAMTPDLPWLGILDSVLFAKDRRSE